MQNESRFPAAPIGRGRNPLRAAVFLTLAVAMLVVLSVILQAVLGDENLNNEGGLWQMVSREVCRVTNWSSTCVADSSSPSVSVSTSTSTSVSK
jgi:hypothetical protein